MTGPGHRHFLAEWYAGDFPGSWAEGLVFQHNPATGDRRISGTTASLTGLGSQRRDPDGAFARIFLAHAVVAGWGGVPVIWSGDELALPNDPRLGRRAGPRGRQPLGAPAAGPRRRPRAPPRARQRRRPRPRRAGAPDGRAPRAAAAARLGAGDRADAGADGGSTTACSASRGTTRAVRSSASTT